MAHRSPVFLQWVSSATNSVNYIKRGKHIVFQGGLTLNATPLDISGQFTSDHIQDLKTEAQSGGLVLNNDQNFWFNADGTVTYAGPVPVRPPPGFAGQRSMAPSMWMAMCG